MLNIFFKQIFINLFIFTHFELHYYIRTVKLSNVHERIMLFFDCISYLSYHFLCPYYVPSFRNETYIHLDIKSVVILIVVKVTILFFELFDCIKGKTRKYELFLPSHSEDSANMFGVSQDHTIMRE